MNRGSRGPALAALSLLLLGARAAQAQIAVIDVASLMQLIQQAETLTQQLEAARQQISQAQTLYQSMTGTRGLQLLLSGVNRNYLPTDWADLMAARQGSGDDELSNDVRSMVSANAVLSTAQLAALPMNQQAQIAAQRQAVALLQGVTQEALANSSARFAGSLQCLVNFPIVHTGPSTATTFSNVNPASSISCRNSSG